MTDLKKISDEELLNLFHSILADRLTYDITGEKLNPTKSEILIRMGGKLICSSCGTVITNFEDGDIHECQGKGVLKRI